MYINALINVWRKFEKLNQKVSIIYLCFLEAYYKLYNCISFDEQ